MRAVPDMAAGLTATGFSPRPSGGSPFFTVSSLKGPGLVRAPTEEASVALRKVAVLPTLLTLGNAVCGFASIAVASSIKGDSDPSASLCYMLSAVLIFGAMVFDALDGYVARMARSVSDFGKQLDS